MKFIDDLYEQYRHVLTGDEEDAEIVTYSILSQLTKNELMTLISEITTEELYHLLGSYMVSQLKSKMTDDGLGHSVNHRRIH